MGLIRPMDSLLTNIFWPLPLLGYCATGIFSAFWLGIVRLPDLVLALPGPLVLFTMGVMVWAFYGLLAFGLHKAVQYITR